LESISLRLITSAKIEDLFFTPRLSFSGIVSNNIRKLPGVVVALMHTNAAYLF
jgi:hypothetical protein